MAQSQEKVVSPVAKKGKAKSGAAAPSAKGAKAATTKRAAKVPAKRNAVVPARHKESAPVSATDAILQLVKDPSVDIDKLDKMIMLHERIQDREAEAEFAKHFAQMQKDFVAVVKKAQGYNYKYARLGQLQDHFGPTIADHGFSYRFAGQSIEGKENWRNVTLYISGYGHTQSNSFDVPPVERTQQMNEVQALGAGDTYGERYTFIAGFALPILNEEDDDAQMFGLDVIAAASEATGVLSTSANEDELRENFSFFYKAAKSDEERIIIMDIKDRRKAQLGDDRGTTN